MTGICEISLRLFEIDSLKEKRSIVKSLVEKLKHKYNISVAEVGYNDYLNQSLIEFAVVSNDRKFINEVMDKAVEFVENCYEVEVYSVEKEVV